MELSDEILSTFAHWAEIARRLEDENAALKRGNDELKKQRSHLLAILGVLNTDNEIASLNNYELWSIHGELQKTIANALLTKETP